MTWLDPVLTYGAELAVDLPTLKSWLRVDADDDSQDSQIELLWRAALETITERTGLVIGPASAVMRADGFGTAPRLVLPLGPVRALTSVEYDDGSGALATFGGVSFVHVGSVGALVLNAGAEWPEPEASAGAVVITADVGFAAWADVPKKLQVAAQYLLAHWFRNREAVAIGAAPAVVPLGFDDLLGRFRKFTVA